MSEETLVRVTAPHFVAGIVIRDGKCVEAAPILRWCLHRKVATLRADFKVRGWSASQLKPC